MRRDLFVAGVPVTGKTTLGNWLARERGYLHLDHEAYSSNHFADLGLGKEWLIVESGGPASEFVKAIRGLPRPVVITWGIDPSRRLDVPRALIAEGIETWWLDAEREIARTAFISRGIGRVELFDYQMDQIALHGPALKSLFGSHIVTAMRSDGSRPSSEALWSKMSGAG